MARLSGLKGTGSQVWPRWTWKASQIHCENDSHNVFKRHFLSNCKNPLNFYQAFFQLKVFKRCLDSFQLLIKQNDAKWIIRCASLPVEIESRWRYWKSAVAAVAGQEVYSRQKGRRWSPMSPGSIFVIQMFEFPSWKLLVLQMLRVFRYFSYYHDWLNLFSNHETNQKQKKTPCNHLRDARTPPPHKRSRNIWESTPPAPWRTNLYLRPKSFMKLFLLVWFWEKIR